MAQYVRKEDSLTPSLQGLEDAQIIGIPVAILLGLTFLLWKLSKSLKK